MLQPAQVCDILKGVILVICYFMMHYVDYSMMYHLIRGQSVIKLYIIYNMLEVRPSLTARKSSSQPAQAWATAHNCQLPVHSTFLPALVTVLLAFSFRTVT